MQRKSITKRRGCNGHVPLCYSYIHGKCSKGYITVIQREPDCNMSSRKPCCITCNLLRAFMLAIKLYERSTTSSWPHDTKYTYIVPCNRFMLAFGKSAFYIIYIDFPNFHKWNLRIQRSDKIFKHGRTDYGPSMIIFVYVILHGPISSSISEWYIVSNFILRKLLHV